MKINFLKLSSVFILTLFIALSACKKDKQDDDQSGMKTGVQLASDTKLGTILTNKDGKTLYFFSIDAGSQSGCTGECAIAWPVFYEANPTLATGLDASDFGVITRADGSKQTTYKSWPLYTYAGDSKPGDVNGEALEGIWFVAKPDYAVMLVNTQLVGNDGIEYNSQYTPGKEIVQYITDDHGRTLYHFGNDKLKTNNFTLADLSNDSIWPIFGTQATINVPSTLNKALFEKITVFGKTQLTFNGWPLYYFGGDGGVRGNNKGVSMVHPGLWPVNNKNTTAAPAP